MTHFRQLDDPLTVFGLEGTIFGSVFTLSAQNLNSYNNVAALLCLPLILLLLRRTGVYQERSELINIVGHYAFDFA